MRLAGSYRGFGAALLDADVIGDGFGDGDGYGYGFGYGYSHGYGLWSTTTGGKA